MTTLPPPPSFGGPPSFFNNDNTGGGANRFGGMEVANTAAEYQLITAEILYHMPDHHSVLQTFIWQNLDLFPIFPELKKFLEYWTQHLDGPLHTVSVNCAELLQPRSFTLYANESTIH